MFDDVVVEDLDLLEVLLADGVGLDGVLKQLGEILVVDVARRRVGSVEGLALGVDVDGHRTVVNLIGDSEGGVVVVRGADVPDVVGDGELAVIEVLGIVRPRGGDDLNDPLVVGGHFEDGQHLSEIVLDAGDVHFVEDYNVDVLVIRGLIESSEKLGLVVSLRKFVIVAEQLGTVTPRRLYRSDDGGVAYIFAERVRQRGFTCTGNTLEDGQTTGGEAGYEAAQELDLIPVVHP